MRFAYDAKQRPTLLLKLQGSASSLDAMALVDSGADVNVLPWSVGLSLGLAWTPNKATIRVAGVPAGDAAMPVLLKATFGEFSDVTLAFAWCQLDSVPLVLGQINFFMEFDVCFFRSRGEFQVVRRAE